MQSIIDISKRSFTIVYKTYKGDIEWFKYSLMSLQNYLNHSNLSEILIYSHDEAVSEVFSLTKSLELDKYVNYRILPIVYDFHGYIKQMTVKCNAFRDCSSDYLVILDCDTILKEPLNLSTLIDPESGKIHWFFMSKDDDPDSVVWTVWKKAFEDMTLVAQDKHYMANGFPFVLSKRSMIEAESHFTTLHGCSYDEFCLNRCNKFGIAVHEKIRDVFVRLAVVFEEFEYLGYFCERFSDDYIFAKTSNRTIPHSFTQHWSHGGLSNDIRRELHKMLQIGE